jgi:hypothetical protein
MRLIAMPVMYLALDVSDYRNSSTFLRAIDSYSPTLNEIKAKA